MKRLLLILFLLPLTSYSQGTAVEHFTIRDGLPGNTIRCIYKDTRGLLWIGTDSGLGLYDGKSIEIFNSDNGLSGNMIWAIAEDGDGRMWFSCYGSGLTVYDGKKFESISKADSTLVNAGIRELHYLEDLDQMMGGCDFGFYRFNMDLSHKLFAPTPKNPGKQTVTSGFFQYHEDSVLVMNVYHSPFIYIPSADTSVHYVGNRFYTASGTSSMSHDGDLIMGSDRITRYSSDEPTLEYAFTEHGMKGSAWDIVADEYGNFWGSTWGGGGSNPFGYLIKCSDGSCTDYADDLKIKSEVFWSLYYDDKADQLFIGTLDQGLYVLTYSPFENIDILGEEAKEKFHLYEKKDGTKLLIGQKEIYEIAGDTIKDNLYNECLPKALVEHYINYNLIHFLTRRDSLSDYYSMEKLKEKYGVKAKNLYLGPFLDTIPQGTEYRAHFLKHDQQEYLQKTRTVSSKKWMEDFNIYSIVEWEGYTWYMTNKGLAKEVGDCDYEVYHMHPGPAHVDKKGRLWIFQEYHPMMMMEDSDDIENFVRMDYAQIVAPNSIVGHAENNQGDILFASWDRGLFDYEGGTEFVQYNSHNSFLTTDAVRFIKTIQANYILVSLTNGDLMICNYEDTLTLAKTINESSGLHINVVSDAMVSDGVLYIWHDKGISFAPFAEVLDNEVTSYGLIDEGEGYHVQDGNLYELSDGLYFLHNTGYVKVNWQTEYQFQKVDRQLKIGRILIDYEELKWNDVDIANWESIPSTMTLDYFQNNIIIEFDVINLKNSGKDLFRYKLEGLSDSWSNWSNENRANFAGLQPGSYTLHLESKNLLDPSQIETLTYSFVISPPWWQTVWFRILAVCMIVLGIVLFFRWRTAKLRQRQKVLEEKIDEATKEIRHQKDEIEEAHQEITDSIAYAKRIQSAILPPDGYFQERLPKSFVLYKPKDVVAGDFYWMEEKDGKILFAAADCTGHGVPGAMVSVICNNGLNRSVRENGLTEPGKILEKTREYVLQEFQKSTEDVKDGMDIALVSLAKSEVGSQKSEVLFSGAMNPLWIIRKGSSEVEDIRGDKQPIGKFDHADSFTTHSVDLNEGDTIYVFSDGYADQFGGEKGKKLKGGAFKKILLEIQHLPMSEQRDILDARFEEWRGNYEQIDDVCVIGVRV